MYFGDKMADKMMCKVRAYRTYEGMSQRELAALIGTSASSVCEIESGDRLPNVLLAIRIARALGTTVEELWKETG